MLIQTHTTISQHEQHTVTDLCYEGGDHASDAAERSAETHPERTHRSRVHLRPEGVIRHTHGIHLREVCTTHCYTLTVNLRLECKSCVHIPPQYKYKPH